MIASWRRRAVFRSAFPTSCEDWVLRLMIWEMALPCPRIVSVEMRSLKKTHLEWEREKEVSNKTAENTTDSETMPEASRATSHDCERPGVDPPLIDGHLPGIKSNTPPPQILLACCESFAAATKFYERVFSIDPSSGGSICLSYDLSSIASTI